MHLGVIIIMMGDCTMKARDKRPPTIIMMEAVNNEGRRRMVRAILFVERAEAAADIVTSLGNCSKVPHDRE